MKRSNPNQAQNTQLKCHIIMLFIHAFRAGERATSLKWTWDENKCETAEIANGQTKAEEQKCHWHGTKTFQPEPLFSTKEEKKTLRLTSLSSWPSGNWPADEPGWLVIPSQMIPTEALWKQGSSLSEHLSDNFWLQLYTLFSLPNAFLRQFFDAVDSQDDLCSKCCLVPV